MGEFLKMDVFFMITTVAVVVLTILSSFVLWRLERILRHVEHVSKQVAAESDMVRLDLAEMRGEVREGKSRLLSLIRFLGKSAKRAMKD